MFFKTPQLIPINPEKVNAPTLYHAGQAFDQFGNQLCNQAFALNWIRLVRETYRQAAIKHPNSKIKRAAYLSKMHPYGLSIYRNPSRFLRWYLNRNGTTIGDPTGGYYVPINSKDLSLIPHPKPNMLADNFTLALVKYSLKKPKIRITRKNTGYGFVKLVVPPYVSLEKPKDGIQWTKRVGGTQISGYLTDEVLQQVFRSEVGEYIRQFKECIDPQYRLFLNEFFGVNE